MTAKQETERRPHKNPRRWRYFAGILSQAPARKTPRRKRRPQKNRVINQKEDKSHESYLQCRNPKIGVAF
jgi:hypothetical protein